MGSLVVVLTALSACCSAVHALPTTTARLEDIAFTEGSNKSMHAFDKENPRRSVDSPQRKLEESKTPDSATVGANGRKSRFLGSLAFLAGLSFGGLTAASSNVKNIAKLPQTASLSLNLGPSKNSPYLTAYYNPYSLLPYPLFYSLSGPLGLLPMADLAKPHATPSDDLTPQVINLFDNREPGNLLDNEDYEDEEKNSNDAKRANDKNGADSHAESRGEADRNAEEKTMTRDCKEGQRKHGSSVRGSAREREDLRMDGEDSWATLKFRAANTSVDANQTTTTMTTDSSKSNENITYHHHHYNHNFTRPSSGYFGGHPQPVSHVHFTTDSDSYRYPNYEPFNYDLSYEKLTNPITYHYDKYNVYPGPHVNAHFAGPFSSNEYISPDLDRSYQPEYQPPYADGFKPVK